MARCILVGGTAVNIGLWLNVRDSTLYFEDGGQRMDSPTGITTSPSWQLSDMAADATQVFPRIPGIDHPSLNNELYLQTSYSVVL